MTGRNEKTKPYKQEESDPEGKGIERQIRSEWEESEIRRGSCGVMKRWREILMAQQKKMLFFTHLDSFFPGATHCALLTHAWGEIFNMQLLTGMCADMHRQISLPNSESFFFFL